MLSFITINTPQGCVLSPVRITLYTSDCMATTPTCTILKYADDTVIIGCMGETNSNDEYLSEITNFSKWCSCNNLLLNVSKTKEMLFDFRRSTDPCVPVVIGDKDVEQVTNYKYLGTIVDNKLSWNDNIQNIRLKAHKRLYFLRKLKEFSVSKVIMRLFYNSIVKSVMSFCILVWFGNLTKAQLTKLVRIDKCAKRIIGDEMCIDWNCEYETMIHRKVTMLLNSLCHPLSTYIKYLPSGRRLRAIKCRTSRFRKSFIPNSVIIYNKL